MKGINKELDEKIKRECMLKDALNAARDTVKEQRPVVRRKIEDIKELHELKKLEDDWLNG